jgi:hypothetical protein
MAKFEKGNGGKPKGANNKVVQEARALFVQTLEGQVPNIQEAFEEVRIKDPSKYLELFAKYAQYFIPKKVDVTTNGETIEQVFKIGNTEIKL